MRNLCALSVLLILLLGVAVTAWAYTDGVYVGEGNGIHGAIKVEVKVSQGKIESIKVLEHNETPGISDAAFQKVIPAIIEKQSVEVDSVTGATLTSRGIMEAVKNALEGQ